MEDMSKAIANAIYEKNQAALNSQQLTEKRKELQMHAQRFLGALVTSVGIPISELELLGYADKEARNLLAGYVATCTHNNLPVTQFPVQENYQKRTLFSTGDPRIVVAR